MGNWPSAYFISLLPTRKPQSSSICEALREGGDHSFKKKEKRGSLPGVEGNFNLTSIAASNLHLQAPNFSQTHLLKQKVSELTDHQQQKQFNLTF